jgi:hypothetical protein
MTVMTIAQQENIALCHYWSGKVVDALKVSKYAYFEYTTAVESAQEAARRLIELLAEAAGEGPQM